MSNVTLRCHVEVYAAAQRGAMPSNKGSIPLNDGPAPAEPTTSRVDRRRWFRWMAPVVLASLFILVAHLRASYSGVKFAGPRMEVLLPEIAPLGGVIASVGFSIGSVLLSILAALVDRETMEREQRSFARRILDKPWITGAVLAVSILTYALVEYRLSRIRAAVTAYADMVDAYNRKDATAYASHFADPMDCFYRKKHASLPVGRTDPHRMGRLNLVTPRPVRLLGDRLELCDVGQFHADGRWARHAKTIVMEERDAKWLVVVEVSKEAGACYPSAKCDVD